MEPDPSRAPTQTAATFFLAQRRVPTHACVIHLVFIAIVQVEMSESGDGSSGGLSMWQAIEARGVKLPDYILKLLFLTGYENLQVRCSSTHLMNVLWLLFSSFPIPVQSTRSFWGIKR